MRDGGEKLSNAHKKMLLKQSNKGDGTMADEGVGAEDSEAHEAKDGVAMSGNPSGATRKP